MPTTNQPIHEPHKIKTVRPIAFPNLEERKRNLSAARFNVHQLTPSQVTFDMVSLGTSAMTQEQLAGQLIGDEAYAGARNFETLNEVITRVLGHTYVCPTHNTLGAVKLLLRAFAKEGGSSLPSNARGRVDVHAPRGIEIKDARDRKDPVFTGNFDLDRLRSLIEESRPPFIGGQAFADGQHPFSLANLRAVRKLADSFGLRIVLDISRVIENAWYIQKHETGLSDRSIADLVLAISKTAHVILMDGAQDPRSNTGGFLATDNPADHEHFMNDVVVFEGLHTYGGMAGRTMEVLARGLSEMCDEVEVQWVMYQTERFCARLADGGVPVERGCDGAYIQADEFLAQKAEHSAHAVAAALYETSGVRAMAQGLVGRDAYLPVQIPRLAMTNTQLDQVADAIIALHGQRDRIPSLDTETKGEWHDQLRFRSVFADLDSFEFDCDPYIIHTLEPIARTTREQRLRAIREAGYNTFLLRSADVTIDLLTDSGTTAMSTRQWAAYDAAIPTPGTSDAYLDFVSVVKETYGYDFILPTHQGRAAEQILSEVMIRPGQLVPGNMYFTTTKLHQELAGGIFADVIVDEAHQPSSDFRWKGNIDLGKLDALVKEKGADGIAYISFELSVNMAGGQPVSMDNLREVYGYCSKHNIPVMFDATRAVENAYMIQKHDPRFHDAPVRDILREMMLYGDGCTVSGKKDYLINIGGLLAFKDNAEWAKASEAKIRVYEGGVRDGGLPSADLAAMAQGMREMVDDHYIRSRVEQAVRLASWLEAAGVPIVRPTGSHAVFLDAREFLSHLDQDEYPAQRLAAEIYVETGVRAMERGNVSKGRKPDGHNYRPQLELVRLTLPRRVYSDDHLRAVADGIVRLYERRESITGLRFTYEPAELRFFQGRFEPIS